MSYGRLKAVLNKENLIYHNGSDFVMKGKHLRSTIIKARKPPIKKRRKGSLLAQQELDEMQKNEASDILEQSDVMWIQVNDEWQIDDSYVFIE